MSLESFSQNPESQFFFFWKRLHEWVRALLVLQVWELEEATTMAMGNGFALTLSSHSLSLTSFCFPARQASLSTSRTSSRIRHRFPSRRWLNPCYPSAASFRQTFAFQFIGSISQRVTENRNRKWDFFFFYNFLFKDFSNWFIKLLSLIQLSRVLAAKSSE